MLLFILLAKQILLHTELVKFYLQNGFIVDNLSLFLEYEPGKCFKEFYEKSYALRVKATKENNQPLAQVTKITMNSSKCLNFNIFIILFRLWSYNYESK